MNDAQVQLLIRFITASLGEKQWILDDNPELINDAFLVSLNELITKIQEVDPENPALKHINVSAELKRLIKNRDLIIACREHSITAVFNQIVRDVGQVIHDFLGADTWAEKRPILESSPELQLLGSRIPADDIVEDIFAKGIAAATEANATRAIRQLKQHREVLRQYRTDGPVLLFARMDSKTDPGAPNNVVGLLQDVRHAFDTYESTNDRAALDAAAAFAKELLVCEALASTLPPFQIGALKLCASVFLHRYNLDHSSEDLDYLVWAYDLAVPQIYPDRASLSIALVLCSYVLFERFQRSKNIDDLHLAIFDSERALTVVQATRVDTFPLLAQLAQLLAARDEVLETGDDLDRAIAAYAIAVEGTPDGEPEHAEQLSGLGVCLLRRYQRRGDRGDLDRAIDLLEQAVTGSTVETLELTNRYANLANALAIRFEIHREPDDVNRAITALRIAIDHCPPDNATGLQILYGRLAGNLRERYQVFYDIDDLNAAIDTIHKSVTLLELDTANGTPGKLEVPISADLTDLRTALDELGSRLWDRFQHLGNLSDLNDAIAVFERAVEITPPDAENWASALNNLAAALRDRSRHEPGAPGDLDRAIKLHQAAVKGTKDNSHERAAHVNNLGAALLNRAKHTLNTGDIDEAIEKLREGVSLTDPSAIEYPRHLARAGRITPFG